MRPRPSTFCTPERPSLGRVLQACSATAATVLALLSLGHEGRRTAQLFVLAAPAFIWLAWPVRGVFTHRVRTALVLLWAMAFALDGVLRSYLLDTYLAAPDSAMVLGTVANTNGRESIEYLTLQWRSILIYSATLLVAVVVFVQFARLGARGNTRWPRWAKVLTCTLLVLCAVGYASKPWRRLHPIAYWTHWAASAHALRSSWTEQQDIREMALATARRAATTVSQEGPATVVLVITDSVNRDNMSLYGYERSTTPRLSAQKRLLDPDMVVLRNAWSTEASTIPALRSMLQFGEPVAENPEHVLALARAAGYKVWWMSNHDDLAIEHQHARLADVVEMVNRTPGRAGASLDGELLGSLREALEDMSERKLIVVHLLGTHPHYRLRFPVGENPFDGHVDVVDMDLAEKGRSLWVRRARQEYDAAMLYHDFVVAETLQLARTAGRTDESRAWMYLSDHGQEVGHEINRAGHSAATAAGYRIPVVIWRNQWRDRSQLDAESRPFRADWMGWTLADLLGIDWPGNMPSRNVMRESYRWTPPGLPLEVRSFADR